MDAVLRWGRDVHLSVCSSVTPESQQRYFTKQMSWRPRQISIVYNDLILRPEDRHSSEWCRHPFEFCETLYLGTITKNLRVLFAVSDILFYCAGADISCCKGHSVDVIYRSSDKRYYYVSCYLLRWYNNQTCCCLSVNVKQQLNNFRLNHSVHVKYFICGGRNLFNSYAQDC